MVKLTKAGNCLIINSLQFTTCLIPISMHKIYQYHVVFFSAELLCLLRCSLFVFQSLFSTTALGLGGKYFLFYEIEGAGVQWGNIAVSPRENDDFSLLRVLCMMAADTVTYFVLAWYIENVHPGKTGYCFSN